MTCAADPRNCGELTRRTVLAGGLGLAGMAASPAMAGRQSLGDGLRRVGQTVQAADGVYHGQVLARTCRYPAIRYARALRFRAPEPVLVAEQAAGPMPACPQPSGRYHPVSEDCLMLNVWAPRRAGADRPVMVYFHGGAYSTGSVTDPLNDGARLAAQGDVVVVTVNHRLNALGYLYLARLDPRFADCGNCGQLDLIAALQWIRRNIEAFGGNPANVTLFGQSGGGAKIATLMAMPEAAGLFHKAITMSGQQVTVSGPLNATRRAQAVIDRLGPGLDLASAPVEQLIAALAGPDPILGGGGVYMGPVLDMKHLARHPFWPDAAPQGQSIPLLLGNTVAETRAFFPPAHRLMQGLDWHNLASRAGPELKIDISPEWVVAQFRGRYPQDDPAAIFHRMVTAARSWRGQVIEAEARVLAEVRQTAPHAAIQTAAKTWVYQLDFEQAGHTDDIGLSFGTMPDPTSARQTMSDVVMAAFVRFARTGDPGWAAYDLDRRSTMVFDTVSRVVENPRQWERELFARVPYIQPGS